MPTVKELLEFSRDGEWGKGEPTDGHVRMRAIRGTDFERVRVGDLRTLPQRFIKAKQATIKRLQPWDIVFEVAGGSKDRPTGRSLLLRPRLFEKADAPLVCASFARFLRFDASKVDPEYMFWLLQARYEDRTLFAYHTQHTGVARFQYTVFSEAFEFELPPLPTQHRIAAVLSAYDDLIEVNTRRIAILEEMARRVYEESAAGQKLTLKLPEIGEVTYGYPFKSRQFHDDPSAGVGVIRIRDVRSHNPSTFTAEQGKPHHIVCEGDVLIGMDGEFHMSVWSGPEAWLNQRVARLRATPPYSNALLFEAVRKPIRHLNDTIVGTTVAHLSAKDLKTLEVPRFDEAELKRLNAQLGPMHELAVSLRRQNANLRAQRDLLLPRLVSGKLSVDDAERHIKETAA